MFEGVGFDFGGVGMEGDVEGEFFLEEVQALGQEEEAFREEPMREIRVVDREDATGGVGVGFEYIDGRGVGKPDLRTDFDKALVADLAQRAKDPALFLFFRCREASGQLTRLRPLGEAELSVPA